MPQMAPMNWTLLFVMFITIYMMSMVLIYYTSKPSLIPTSSTNTTLNTNNNLWVW